MGMTASSTTPLSRLVLFMVCLSIAGSLAAGLLWYSDTVSRQSAAPPSNLIEKPTRVTYCVNDEAACWERCLQGPPEQESSCRNVCRYYYIECINRVH